MAHHSNSKLSYPFYLCTHTFFLCLSLLCRQATQLAYVIDERLREAAEDADREKALKDVVVATTKENCKATIVAEKRAQEAEKGRVLVEQKLAEMDVKLGRTEFKLAEAKSLNLGHVDEIVDLKVAFEACEDKYYNMGFTNVKGSIESIVYQAQKHGFEKGWMAALLAMGVLDDSPIRNLE